MTAIAQVIQINVSLDLYRLSWYSPDTFNVRSIELLQVFIELLSHNNDVRQVFLGKGSDRHR